MIFSLVTCLCVIATAAGEDTDGDLGWSVLDIHNMVNVKETLVVLQRTHSTNTKYHCQSARRVEQLVNQADQSAARVEGKDTSETYRYILRARNDTTEKHEYVQGEVEVKIENYGQHNKNRASYKNSAHVTFKIYLLKEDDRKSCFVTFVDKSDGRQGCEILSTLSTKDDSHNDCMDFFNERCLGERVTLYQKDCEYI
uniref:Putative secreted protein n=1 Tax=Amblyomma triste TaxID=251400 RepID=A0A023GDW4_AMBTT